MARRIVEGGYPTAQWARGPQTLQPFAGTPADIAEPPTKLATKLAAASGLVCLCVVDDADIAEVVGGKHGLLAGAKPGSVITVRSTVHPNTCKRLANTAGIQGVRSSTRR
jgi:3-hydroxyisobutyrate dehydrogenase